MQPSLGVGESANLDQIKSAMEDKFITYIDPMYNKYKKPVIIHISYPSVDGAANGKENVGFLDMDNPSVKYDPEE